MKRIALAAALAFTLPLFAGEEQECSIDPASGPTSGGNTVTVRCNFLGDWPYGVIFGDTGALSTERTAPDTLVAIAPPHLPGTVDISIFEYDIRLASGATYTFVGDAPEALERFLLPVYLPPTQGAFGSEFVTAFRARAKKQAGIQLTGLRLTGGGPHLELGHNFYGGFTPEQFEYSGAPGRFFYVNDEYAEDFAATLHVYDTSRAGENHGTEIPIVRETEFDTQHLLLGVPLDPRYRNTLRIYGTAPGAVTVTIGDGTPFNVQLQAGENLFLPAYAQFTDFAAGMGTADVKIEANAPVWAFVSTTNNDTQLITTITP